MTTKSKLLVLIMLCFFLLFNSCSGNTVIDTKQIVAEEYQDITHCTGGCPLIALIDLPLDLSKELMLTTYGYVRIGTSEVLFYFSPVDLEYDNRENALIIEKSMLANCTFYPEAATIEDFEGEKVELCVYALETDPLQTNGCIARIKDLHFVRRDDTELYIQAEGSIDHPLIPSEEATKNEDAREISIYRFAARSWEYKGQKVKIAGMINVHRQFGEYIIPVLSWPYMAKEESISPIVDLSYDPRENIKRDDFLLGYRRDDSAMGDMAPVFSSEYINHMGVAYGSVSKDTGKTEPVQGFIIATGGLIDPILERYTNVRE